MCFALYDSIFDQMRSVDKEGWYGLGTIVNRMYGIDISFHPGGGFGIRSEMYWLPEYDCGSLSLRTKNMLIMVKYWQKKQ
jgi:hypothetical protein